MSKKGHISISISDQDYELARTIWMVHFDRYKSRADVLRQALLALAEELVWPENPTPVDIADANKIRQALGYPMLDDTGKELPRV